MGASIETAGRTEESQPIEAALRIGDSVATAERAKTVAPGEKTRPSTKEQLMGVLRLECFVDRRPRQLQRAGNLSDRRAGFVKPLHGPLFFDGQSNPRPGLAAADALASRLRRGLTSQNTFGPHFRLELCD